MPIIRAFIWVMILKIHPSVGFPPDALTGSAAFTKHHAEITRGAIRIAVGRYIKDNNLTLIDDTTDVFDAVKTLFGNDSDGYEKFIEKETDIIENVKDQEKSKEAYIHCNSEQIELAHNHVIKLRKQIAVLAQSTEPDLSLIRKMIGKCIYTIQAFYSGSNWVEMNGDSVYKDFETNDNFDQGKCGFGGSTDTENGFRTAKGGINKDRLDYTYSPHHHLHYKAFYSARKATEQFLIDQDDTGSIGDEIEEVRKACIDIITNVFGTPNAPSNYILVTFNDPVKHMHRLTTSNGLEMISALGNITVDGGFDCPEYAMSGLEKAIELCQEQSTIFFYTDAPAKDEAERDTVINAAEEKHIDLQLFVHNETCGPLRKKRATERTKRDVEPHVYSQVAEGTGGAIYRFNTSLLGELMIQISEEIFPSATAIVDTFELRDGETNQISFPVDSMLNNVKITVIGATSAADVDIESPLGSIMTAVTTSVYFKSPDKVVVSVLYPTTGIYKLLRTGNNYWYANITAQTSVDFHYLMTEEAEDGYFYRISGKPIVGEQYRIYLTVYDLPVGMDASGVRLETNDSPTNNLDITEVAGDFGTTYFVSTTLSSDVVMYFI
ncbi:Hypothetical predicted protein [Mytilus galloprovincialis]|nr:Hypothetical predicted protein [Mytilus galloprovincialis]